MLSPGLRFGDQARSGGTRVVWQGDAQRGRAINIPVTLVATAPGSQTVKVILMPIPRNEAGAKSARRAVIEESETMRFNVLQR